MRRIDDTIISVPANLISPDPAQPRVEADDELLSSIEERGQLEPIHVREHPHEAGHYMIINGERRWSAIRNIGENAPVDVIVYEVGPAAQLFIDQLVSNVARRQLTLTEEIRALKRSSELGLCPETIAKSLGVSVATVRADLPLADLPDKVINQAVKAGLPKQVLRSIARHEDPTTAIRAARKARGKSTKEMLAAIDYSSQQAGEVDKDTYDPAAGKALDKLIKRVNQFVKTTAVSDAVAARTGKLNDLQFLVSKMRRLTGELETEVARQAVKRAA